DRGTADAVDRGNAGADGDAVNMHGAGAAQRHAAAELRSGHAEDIAQHPQQRGVAINIDRSIDAVDLDGGGHSFLQAVRVDRACEGSRCANPLRRRRSAPPRHSDAAEAELVRGALSMHRHPICAKRPNLHKDGVDTFIQLASAYLISRRYRKWVGRSCLDWYALAPIFRLNNDGTGRGRARMSAPEHPAEPCGHDVTNVRMRQWSAASPGADR